MAGLKSLAKDTAIYGVSSIVGRFLNYLLVPLYTAKIAASSGGYGVITNIYAYTALLLVVLTYGMETAFFRFANKEGVDARRVYSTALYSVAATSLLFIALVVAFIGPVSGFLGYADHPAYVWTMAVTVAIDAFQCIPFAYLRFRRKPIKFATLKLLFIVLNIALNLTVFVVLPMCVDGGGSAAFGALFSSPDVGWAFYINLFCTAMITLFFYRELSGFRHGFDRRLLRQMLAYGWPILVLGIAGILNQTADKILFPYIYGGDDAHAQLGIYGAASKIAMIMAMITQAFRYAYEPFVFGKAREGDSRATYARAMGCFVAFTLLAFLLVTGYIDILKYIIGRDYWPGLSVVPIVMAAEIMMGVYFNLSFWYKLIDRTIWGAVFSGAGCLVLVAVNVLFVPRYGYTACAWGGFAGYGTAMLLSYVVGQRQYPIRYPLRTIGLYTATAAALFAAMTLLRGCLPAALSIAANTVFVALFAVVVARNEHLVNIIKAKTT